MINDSDYFTLMNNVMSFVTGGDHPSFRGKTRKEAAAYFGAQLSPVVQAPLLLAFEETFFLSKGLDRLRIPLHMIHYDSYMASLAGSEKNGWLFDTTGKGKSWFTINLERERIEKTIPGEFDPKTKASPGAQSSTILNQHSTPLLEYDRYTPKTPQDGMKWWILNNIVGPGMLAQKPMLGGPAIGAVTGRPAQITFEYDKGDIMDFMFERDSMNQVIETLFEGSGKSIKSIMREAKRKNLTEDETRQLFSNYILNLRPAGISRDDTAVMFDLYIRPVDVPAEVYYYKLWGWRHSPIMTNKMIVGEKIREILRKLKDQ
jgi:hypothetical protein